MVVLWPNVEVNFEFEFEFVEPRCIFTNDCDIKVSGFIIKLIKSHFKILPWWCRRWPLGLNNILKKNIGVVTLIIDLVGFYWRIVTSECRRWSSSLRMSTDGLLFLGRTIGRQANIIRLMKYHTKVSILVIKLT